MNKPSKKILEAARNHLYAEARFVAWDNHDDMDDSDRWEHTFNYLVNDKVSIEDFVKEHLSDDVEKAKYEAMSEGNPDDTEYWEGVWDSFDERFV